MLLRKKTISAEDLARAATYGREAEALHRSGTHHCAEAVLAVICRFFRPDLPLEIVQSASGFGGGSSAGCLCGAVSGGTVGIGLVLRDNKKLIMKLTGELHAWFRERFGVTCCKTIRATNEKSYCPVITGEVAAKIAELLIREQ